MREKKVYCLVSGTFGSFGRDVVVVALGDDGRVLADHVSRMQDDMVRDPDGAPTWSAPTLDAEGGMVIMVLVAAEPTG